MPNLPNFDFSKRLIQTWSAALLGQAEVWNNAWLNITSADKTYTFKQWLADVANSIQLNQDVMRDLAKFDTGRVDWIHVSVGADVTKPVVAFDLSPRIQSTRSDQIRFTKAAALGAGPSGPNGKVDIAVKSTANRTLEISITTDNYVVDGDQWIAFAYETLAVGPPVGVVLVLIENPSRKEAAKPGESLASLAAERTAP